MLRDLRRSVDKSGLLIICSQIYKNWFSKRTNKEIRRESTCGSVHKTKTLKESLDYIDSVFFDYLRYSQISEKAFHDKKILEIGHGDNLGVALRFLAAGAKQVVCLDKYYTPRDTDRERRIYKALRERLNSKTKLYFDASVDLSQGIKVNPRKLLTLYGVGVERAEALFKPKSFNFIVSNTVLQYISDVDGAFKVMDRLLVPGGWMLHRIDFRDFLFEKRGFHSLTYLTVPGLIYSLMVGRQPMNNRRLINYYRDKMAKLKYKTKILVTHILASDIHSYKEGVKYGRDYSAGTLALVKQIRPKLVEDFKNLTSEDIMVRGIFLIARKSLEK